MGGDIETIKQRLEIAEVVGGYVKLEKSGQSLKGRCPFHNEKTPSFFVSPGRQSYYCFGCGAKGDIFTFVQEVEGLSFKEALKTLADKAGVELKGQSLSREAKSEREEMLQVVEEATKFFENELAKNKEGRDYLQSRGIGEETRKEWRIGFAPAEWRSLYSYLLNLGIKQSVLLKAGLVKKVASAPEKNPYDVFRDRLTFPLSDQNGEIVAFSGRALGKGVEPKYLNSPDTPLFTKSELLYGLDKAKNEIRKKNYAVLVEGQMDLVLSHQAGIKNTVASSGTAFTEAHLNRLKKLSPRIILAFDGDSAGEKAGEKASELALSLGLEVKVAKLPTGKDPADVIRENPEDWKEILRQSKSAVEHHLERILEIEPDRRKALKLINSKLLPLLALVSSSMERSHFVSLIAKRTGMKEEIIWEDLKQIKKAPVSNFSPDKKEAVKAEEVRTQKEIVQERLNEVRSILSEIGSGDSRRFKEEEAELLNRLERDAVREELIELNLTLAQAEAQKNEEECERVMRKIQDLHKTLKSLEDKGKKV